MVEECKKADKREADLYHGVFMSFSRGDDLEDYLTNKFRDFETLLGTVNRMVVNRDAENAGGIA